MLKRAQNFHWASFLCILNLQVFAQDLDSMQVSLEPTGFIDDSLFVQKVDSLWLQLIDERLGFLNDSTLDTAIITLPETSDQYKKGFEQLNRKTPLNLVYNEELDPYINSYLRYKGELSKLLGLSKLYFPEMEKQLDLYQMPLELRNLSVVESALNPNARSYKGATGLWQFMLPTGKEYGLTINSYIDERKDFIKSTEAACIYLNQLYSIYGVWELAIAAYNCGPGNVNKAIRFAGGSNNFWEIRPYLPRETRKYVPKFMAMCYLMEYGELHGIKPMKLDLEFWQVDTVTIKKEIRFDQIEEFTDISNATLKSLNPHYKLGVIPASDDGMTLVIPVKYSAQFAENRDSISTYKPNKKTQYIKQAQNTSPNFAGNKSYYKVRSGDVLGTIAERNGVTVSQLRRWNGIRGSRIKVGQTLVLYKKGSSKTNSTVSDTTPSKIIETSSGNFTYHTVRKGDTLWDIAKLYSGVSVEDIRKLNTGINPNNLKMGYKLKIKKI